MVRGVVPLRLRADQAGISLVETLVALVLGLAMVSVAFNLYVSNRGVFRQIEAMVRLQESASIAAALLETSIRHAGGTLCRDNPPTTILLDVVGDFPGTTPTYEYSPPYAFWQESMDSGTAQVGVQGYESTSTDTIVGEDRKAGDSISLFSDNMGAVARVTGRATHSSADNGQTGTYNFPVDNGLEFPVGTVAMACDQVRAVLFQVNESTMSTIKLQSGTGAPALVPGNCSVAMRRLKNSKSPEFVDVLDGGHSCTTDLVTIGGAQIRRIAMYTFGPGSMIGEHTFEHWYIGRKTGTTDGLSLFRRRMVNASGTIGLGAAEEIAQDVTDMQITYLRGQLSTGYPALPSPPSWRYYTAYEIKTGSGYYAPGWGGVLAVRIVLTLTSPERVGLAAAGAASAVTYTIPINVAIRDRMPGVVRR